MRRPRLSVVPDTSHNDRELIQLSLDGDSSAFGMLVRRHHAKLKPFVFAMTRDNHTTEDLLQETYLRAYRSLASFRNDSAFSTWLRRIAYNVTIELLRRQSSVLGSGSDVADTLAANNSASETDAATRVDILDALASLSVEARAVVLLIDGEGYSYKEAAQLLDMSRDTISSRLHQARKHLRTQLQVLEYQHE